MTKKKLSKDVPIQDLSSAYVYGRVASGSWSPEQFEEWFKSKVEMAENLGWQEGKRDANMWEN